MKATRYFLSGRWKNTYISRNTKGRNRLSGVKLLVWNNTGSSPEINAANSEERELLVILWLIKNTIRVMLDINRFGRSFATKLRGIIKPNRAAR
jgi:hypothetical protein